MIGIAIDLIACAAAATSILYAHISGVHSQRSGQNAMDAAAFSRRDAEQAAADPAPLEVDRGTVAPARRLAVVRALHTDSDEARERLVDGARQRHPQMSPQAEGMATPGAAVAVDAPGVVSKP